MTGRQHLPHEDFADAIAALALDALDAPAERAALDAHLAQCDACRTELDLQRAAVNAIGLGVEPVAPPAALRARVLSAAAAPASTAALDRRAGAAAQPHSEHTPRAGAPIFAWLTAAAAVIVAAGSLVYP
mgnify:CR=1 FL=1